MVKILLLCNKSLPANVIFTIRPANIRNANLQEFLIELKSEFIRKLQVVYRGRVHSFLSILGYVQVVFIEFRLRSSCFYRV